MGIKVEGQESGPHIVMEFPNYVYVKAYFMLGAIILASMFTLFMLIRGPSH